MEGFAVYQKARLQLQTGFFVWGGSKRPFSETP